MEGVKGNYKDYEFNQNHIFLCIRGMKDYSYKRYRNLSDKNKDILDKANLYPEELNIVLKFIEIGWDIHYAINFIKVGGLDLYDKYCTSNPGFTNKSLDRELTRRQYEKEIAFRGFIPISEYKKVRDRYDYILSKRKINGEYWIYPERFASGYKYCNKYMYLYKGWTLIGAYLSKLKLTNIYNYE